ncbi:alpha-1,3-mannosyltransferase [Fusarium heterosporum]|uniref:Alpha-1,3-mannosyltransferase n=1 Tax=Fusarium heterosporum TaxID=42747 RepID=A0A8H5TMD5_FUSHE|nr:alpha-1,3-mannosyltransferase [Fusarium heterosporum]
MLRMPSIRMSAKSVQITGAIAAIWLLAVAFYCYRDVSFSTPTPSANHGSARPNSPNLESINLGARYFADYPLKDDPKAIFGELGERTELLRSWIDELQLHAGAESRGTAELVAKTIESLYPYSNSDQGLSPPLADIYNRLGLPYESTSLSNPKKAPAGIVIPTGDKTLRFACHLIASLTRVHKTALPIQVVYAGDGDLSAKGREKIQEAANGVKIEMLDVLTVFDDSTLKLADGGWAIKPFAALASRYEQVILLDADAVFFQDPQRLLEQDRFQETGVLLFHDRLLWKNGFADRQDWWHDQIKHPSPETNKSLVWTERYSEEGDSGIVVVDKSRLDVLLGLLHIGWQNSDRVRNEVTYKITYGDKESWWIGFEATGSKYSFSPHYGGIVGWPGPTKEEKKEGEAKEKREEKDEEKEKEKEVRVCSFVIAHVDQEDKLLWYNGGLLKNKAVNQKEFEVPTHWMIDQKWHKGGSKKDMSCMSGTKASELSTAEKDVLARSIEVAKDMDEKLGLI